MTQLAFIAKFAGETWCDLVHAETRGKAKMRFWREWGSTCYADFQDVRLRRLPGQDDLPFTFEATKAAGFQYNADCDDDFNYASSAEYTSCCDCVLCGGREK